MKKLTILFVFLFSISKSQTVSSNCLASDNIKAIYKKDADRLSIRRVNKILDTYKDSIIINKTLSTNYLNNLIAVYNATLLAAVDTIITLNIHTKNPDVNSLGLSVDSNAIWLKNIKKNIFPTGNLTVDTLITKFYLIKTYYSAVGYVLPYHLLSFKTDTNCNIIKLSQKFLTIPYVISSQPDNAGYTDTYDITDSVNTGFTELTYSYGWGGCTSSCIFRRYWKFKVYNNYSVQYMGSYGDPLISYVGINENQIKLNQVIICPNPIINNIQIKLPNNFNCSNSTLIIYNSSGNQVYYLNKFENNQQINLESLSNGIYFLKINSSNNYKTFKIIKQ